MSLFASDKNCTLIFLERHDKNERKICYQNYMFFRWLSNSVIYRGKKNTFVFR